MGQALRLAFAGTRARGGSSVAVLLLLVVALSAAVVGPVFLRAADESAVLRAVCDGPVTEMQLRVESTDTAVAPHQVISDAQRLLPRRPVSGHVYLDETKRHSYLVAAAVVLPAAQNELRRAVCGLVVPGQRRLIGGTNGTPASAPSRPRSSPRGSRRRCTTPGSATSPSGCAEP